MKKTHPAPRRGEGRKVVRRLTRGVNGLVGGKESVFIQEKSRRIHPDLRGRDGLQHGEKRAGETVRGKREQQRINLPQPPRHGA